jgi:hypothetical protein
MQPARLRPLGIGETLDAALKIYTSRAKTLMMAVFVVVAPVQVFGALVRISLPSGNGFGDTPSTPDAAAIIGSVAATLLVFVLTTIAGQLATATSLKAVSAAYLGEEEDWRASLRFAFSRLWSLVWVAFLILFLAGFALLGCVVPGVYLYFSWIVAVPVLLLEDRRGWSALRRSRELVKGRWWQVFVCIMVAIILTTIVAAAFQGVLLAIVIGAHSAATSAIAGGLASIISAVLITPFTASVIAVVYFDLRVRKEGFDLALLARTIGVTPPPEAPMEWAPDQPTYGQPTYGQSSGPPGTYATPPNPEQPPYWPPPPGWRPGGG